LGAAPETQTTKSVITENCHEEYGLAS
jgi:hypothetical protein